ncbi:hypothetical protein ACT29H_01630 [Thermophagus sp. OGC60D27]|uniref:hypothetical protein n=1 Tax=Thermophagus sp. OGC60D27 TaxID=3458415 RepID=UPI004037B1EB
MRKSDRINKRNRRLVHKFYELYGVKRNRIDDVLKELEEEYFFLDQDYIYSLIFYDKINYEYYNQLLSKSKQPTS